LGMSRMEGLVGDTRAYIHVEDAEENFRRDPSLMFEVFLLAAQRGVPITHRTQRAMETVLRENTQNSRKPDSLHQAEMRNDDLQKAFNRSFIELLRADADIGYAVWRMDEIGFLKQFLPYFKQLNRFSSKDGDVFTIQRQALRTLGTLEDLYEKEKGFVYQRAASVFQKLRSSPEDVRLVRLAILLHPIVEAETDGRFSVQDVRSVIEVFLEQLDMNDVSLRDKLLWLLVHQHHFIRHRFSSNDDIAVSVAEVVNSRGANSNLFPALYVTVFTRQAAEADPESKVMLSRRGAGSPLADLDRFFVAGMEMLDAGSPESHKNLTPEVAARNADEVITWDGKKDLLAQLEDFIARGHWEIVLEDYLAHTRGGDDPGLRSLLAETVQDPKLFEKLFEEFSTHTSTYYMKTMDQASLLKHLFFFRHLFYLWEKKDFATRVTAFFPLPHSYHQAYEVVIGSARESLSNAALYARVLFENGIFVEHAAIRNPPAGPAVARFLGYFSPEDDMPLIQGKIAADLTAIFAPLRASDWLSHLLGTTDDVYFDRADEVYQRPAYVSKKEVRAGREVEVKAQFGEDVDYNEKTTSVFIVRTGSSDWRGQLLVLLTTLSKMHDLNIEHLQFEHLRGFPPETRVFVTTKKGEEIPADQKLLIEKDVMSILSMKEITFRGKEVISERPGEKTETVVTGGSSKAQPVRAEMRAAATMGFGILAGVLETASTAGFLEHASVWLPVPGAKKGSESGQQRSEARRDRMVSRYKDGVVSREGSAAEEFAKVPEEAGREIKPAELPEFDQLTAYLRQSIQAMEEALRTTSDNWEKNFGSKLPGIFKAGLEQLILWHREGRIFVRPMIVHDRGNYSAGFAADDRLVIAQEVLDLERPLLIEYLLYLAVDLEDSRVWNNYYGALLKHMTGKEGVRNRRLKKWLEEETEKKAATHDGVDQRTVMEEALKRLPRDAGLVATFTNGDSQINVWCSEGTHVFYGAWNSVKTITQLFEEANREHGEKKDLKFVLDQEHGVVGTWGLPEGVQDIVKQTLAVRNITGPILVDVSQISAAIDLLELNYPASKEVMARVIDRAIAPKPGEPVLTYDEFKTIADNFQSRIKVLKRAEKKARRNRENYDPFLFRETKRRALRGMGPFCVSMDQGELKDHLRRYLLEGRFSQEDVGDFLDGIFPGSDSIRGSHPLRAMLWDIYLDKRNSPEEGRFFAGIFLGKIFGEDTKVVLTITSVFEKGDLQASHQALQIFLALKLQKKDQGLLAMLLEYAGPYQEIVAAYYLAHVVLFGVETQTSRIGADRFDLKKLDEIFSSPQGKSLYFYLRHIVGAYNQGGMVNQAVDQRIFGEAIALDGYSIVSGHNGYSWFSDLRRKIHTSLEKTDFYYVAGFLRFWKTLDPEIFKSVVKETRRHWGIVDKIINDPDRQAYSDILNKTVASLVERGEISSGEDFLGQLAGLDEEYVIEVLHEVNPAEDGERFVHQVEHMLRLYFAMSEKFTTNIPNAMRAIREVKSRVSGLVEHEYKALVKALDAGDDQKILEAIANLRFAIMGQVLSGPKTDWKKRYQEVKGDENARWNLQYEEENEKKAFRDLLELDKDLQLVGQDLLHKVVNERVAGAKTFEEVKAGMKILISAARFIYSGGLGGVDFRQFLDELEQGDLSYSQLHDLIRALQTEVLKVTQQLNNHMRFVTSGMFSGDVFYDLDPAWQRFVKTEEIPILESGRRYNREFLTEQSKQDIQALLVDELIRGSGLDVFKLALTRMDQILEEELANHEDTLIKTGLPAAPVDKTAVLLDRQFYRFGQPDAPSQDLPPLLSLWSKKGLSLVRMSEAGIPVPPGVVVSSELMTRPDIIHSAPFKARVAEEIERLRKYSKYPDLKLLLYARSGSAFMLPGLLTTIPNIGMNDHEAEELAKSTGDTWFAYDTYASFIRAFAVYVLGIEDSRFQAVLDIRDKDKISGDEMKLIVEKYKEIVRESGGGRTIPETMLDQVIMAMEAVYASWDSPMAKEYRARHRISQRWGTVVILQKGVFGNITETKDGRISGAGSGSLTTTPDGRFVILGEFRYRGQGDQIMSHADQNTVSLNLEESPLQNGQTFEELNPELYGKVLEAALKLKSIFGYDQLFEFIIERGEVWITQSNDEFSRENYAEFVDDAAVQPLVRGKGLSGGAVRGWVANSVEKAKELAQKYEQLRTEASESVKDVDGVILLLDRVNPEMIGLIPKGVHILAKKLSVHAISLAQESGITVVAELPDEKMSYDGKKGVWIVAGQELSDGQVISIDGHRNALVYHNSGNIYPGSVPVQEAGRADGRSEIRAASDRHPLAKPIQRILVVDDSKMLTTLMTVILKKADFIVEVADSGEAALKKLDDGFMPDAILTDVQMPGMNGYEWVAKAVERPGLEQVPIVFISGNAESDQAVRVLAQRHSVHFVEKPFNNEALVALFKNPAENFKYWSAARSEARKRDGAADSKGQGVVHGKLLDVYEKGVDGAIVKSPDFYFNAAVAPDGKHLIARRVSGDQNPDRIHESVIVQLSLREDGNCLLEERLFNGEDPRIMKFRDGWYMTTVHTKLVTVKGKAEKASLWYSRLHRIDETGKPVEDVKKGLRLGRPDVMSKNAYILELPDRRILFIDRAEKAVGASKRRAVQCYYFENAKHFKRIMRNPRSPEALQYWKDHSVSKSTMIQAIGDYSHAGFNTVVDVPEKISTEVAGIPLILVVVHLAKITKDVEELRDAKEYDSAVVLLDGRTGLPIGNARPTVLFRAQDSEIQGLKGRPRILYPSAAVLKGEKLHIYSSPDDRQIAKMVFDFRDVIVRAYQTQQTVSSVKPQRSEARGDRKSLLGPIRKILVVDDERIFANSAKFFLEMSNFSVKVADSGEAALAKLDGFMPDAILTDVQMPGMTGYEWVSEAVRKPGFEQVPIVFMSGDVGDQAAFGQALEALAQDHPVHFMRKPLDRTLIALFKNPAENFQHWPSRSEMRTEDQSRALEDLRDRLLKKDGEFLKRIRWMDLRKLRRSLAKPYKPFFFFKSFNDLLTGLTSLQQKAASTNRVGGPVKQIQSVKKIMDEIFAHFALTKGPYRSWGLGKHQDVLTPLHNALGNWSMGWYKPAPYQEDVHGDAILRNQKIKRYVRKEADAWIIGMMRFTEITPEHHKNFRVLVEKFPGAIWTWSRKPKSEDDPEYILGILNRWHKFKRSKTGELADLYPLERKQAGEDKIGAARRRQIFLFAEGLSFMIQAAKRLEWQQGEFRFSNSEKRSELRRTTIEAKDQLTASAKTFILDAPELPQGAVIDAADAVGTVFSVPGIAFYLPEQVPVDQRMLPRTEAAQSFVLWQVTRHVLTQAAASGISNERLAKVLEMFQTKLPAGVTLPSGSSLEGPQVHAHLTGLTAEDRSALIAHFAVVLGALVSLRGRLLINIDTGLKTAQDIDEKLRALAKREGITLAQDQLKIVSSPQEDPFLLKGAQRVDALVARTSGSFDQVAYRKGIGRRWKTDDAGDMKTLAAALTTVLYATLDKLWETDKFNIHTPSEYDHGVFLATILQAIQGSLQILAAA